jgi:hypothetical protein
LAHNIALTRTIECRHSCPIAILPHPRAQRDDARLLESTRGRNEEILDGAEKEEWPMTDEETRIAQKLLCQTYGVPWVASPKHLKVGIVMNVLEGVMPLNGLTHPIEGDTTGWYIWAGEYLSDDSRFFKPLHVEHLNEWCPMALN